MIKKRKVILSDKIQKIIAQHHERFNGSGYPEGLIGERIIKEAQILALADEFDYMTSINPGKKRMSPKEVLLHFQEEIKKGPEGLLFDPKLLAQLIEIFPETGETPK